jgi:hypothetical protein
MIAASRPAVLYGDFVRLAKPEFAPGIKKRIAFAATVTAEQADTAQGDGRGAGPFQTAACIAPPLDLPEAAQDDFRPRHAAHLHRWAFGTVADVNSVRYRGGCPAGLSLIGWAARTRRRSTLSAAFLGSVGPSLDRPRARRLRVGTTGPGRRRCFRVAPTFRRRRYFPILTPTH